MSPWMRWFSATMKSIVATGVRGMLATNSASRGVAGSTTRYGASSVARASS